MNVRRYYSHIESFVGKLKSLSLLAKLAYVIVGSILLIGMVYAYNYYSRPIILTSDEVAEAGFTLYVPSQTPAGYKLDTEDTKLSGNMLTYSFVSEQTGRSIAVTVQPVPSGFDMTKLIGNGTVSSTSTKNGIIYNLSAGESSKFLLDAGDSLVFFTSKSKIDNATISQLADSLIKQD